MSFNHTYDDDLLSQGGIIVVLSEDRCYYLVFKIIQMVWDLRIYIRHRMTFDVVLII